MLLKNNLCFTQVKSFRFNILYLSFSSITDTDGKKNIRDKVKPSKDVRLIDNDSVVIDNIDADMINHPNTEASNSPMSVNSSDSLDKGNIPSKINVNHTGNSVVEPSTATSDLQSATTSMIPERADPLDELLQSASSVNVPSVNDNKVVNDSGKNQSPGGILSDNSIDELSPYNSLATGNVSLSSTSNIRVDDMAITGDYSQLSFVVGSDTMSRDANVLFSQFVINHTKDIVPDHNFSFFKDRNLGLRYSRMDDLFYRWESNKELYSVYF
jgi:hypothetical protein